MTILRHCLCILCFTNAYTDSGQVVVSMSNIERRTVSGSKLSVIWGVVVAGFLHVCSRIEMITYEPLIRQSVREHHIKFIETEVY